MPNNKKPKVRVATVADLTPDDKNANAGTERGAFMLRQSVEQAGVGRGIVTDRNGKIVGGNKTHATVGELGLEDIVIVSTRGEQLIVNQREDLDLDAAPGTPEHDKARILAIADNRTSEVSQAWVPSVLSDYSQAGVNLGDWFTPAEQSNLFDTTPTDWTSSNQDEEEGEDDPELKEKQKSKPKPGAKIPLAIALGSADIKRWNALKQHYETSGDTKTLLLLMRDLEEQLQGDGG